MVNGSNGCRTEGPQVAKSLAGWYPARRGSIILRRHQADGLAVGLLGPALSPPCHSPCLLLALMLHHIQSEKLGPRGEAMAAAVGTCVHCGFCLPACPTYQELESEMDSPRGRILLMKSVLEGELDARDAAPHLDRCLGCLSCVTHCPSGVRYDELIPSYRAYAREHLPQPPAGLWTRVRRWLAHSTLPYPKRLRVALRLATWTRPLRCCVPRALRPMLELAPKTIPPAAVLPRQSRPQGPIRGRVALLAGCGQQVLAPEINQAAIRVLVRNGIEVLVPSNQGCCGALAWHGGYAPRAAAFAAAVLRAMPEDVDAYVTTAAGCGSTVKEYALVLAGSELEDAARQFSQRCMDISEYLHHVGIASPPPLAEPLRVAYQDACHLAHAQGIRQAPRALLQQIPRLELVDLADADTCCGSAGTYNIEHPEIAHRLGQRKVEAIRQSGAALVATGNIGCLVQMQQHLEKAGLDIPVLHTVQILDKAYRDRQL
ncbi:MAG: glycolate oxidase iron-sulfur subunit [Pirellulaceae bacterium]|nr:MAG: glycolate oxidase iron-sulfur subunit [Pirellulaceae bacterium]